jgi:hypothetical protein
VDEEGGDDQDADRLRQVEPEVQFGHCQKIKRSLIFFPSWSIGVSTEEHGILFMKLIEYFS